jgi:hypothetical protein
MTRRSLLAIAVVLLAAACGQPPVRDYVTIEFSGENNNVTVTAETHFDVNPRGDEVRARVESARRVVESGTDAWSARMKRVDPETEQLVLHRRKGVLDRVTRTIVIPSDELPRVFADIAVTVQVTRGDGWRELALYPGSSSRASRDEQRRFNDELQTWSRAIERYFTAVHHLYSYLDEHPQRARYVFAAMLSEENAAVTEDEEPLMKAVVDSMEDIARRMEAQGQDAQSFAEFADLMFNPFPARFEVRVPGDVIAREGFTEKLTIERVDLMAAVAALEGKWISPDPLALLMREKEPTVEELLEAERKSTAVIQPSEIADALREKLARPKQYIVRWED